MYENENQFSYLVVTERVTIMRRFQTLLSVLHENKVLAQAEQRLRLLNFPIVEQTERE